MKKQCWTAVLVVLFLLLTGCQRDISPQESQSKDSSFPSSEAAVTGQEEPILPSGEETNDTGNQKEPLQLGEGIVSEGSFNDMEARFGPCESYEVTFEGFGTMMYEIRMNYPKMWILLRLSIPSMAPLEERMDSRLQEENGLGDYTLTAEDKNEKGRVQEIQWSDPTVKGPRDTKIGDRLEDVKAKFLDLSDKYNDGQTIYKLSDVDPSYPAELPEDGVEESGAKSGLLSGVAAEYITYYANVPPDQEDSAYWHTYEYTTFYFINDEVSGMDQGYFSELDRP